MSTPLQSLACTPFSQYRHLEDAKIVAPGPGAVLGQQGHGLVPNVDLPFCDRSADEETGQLIVSGLGELHLEVLKHRMQREFRVAANVGTPRVA